MEQILRVSQNKMVKPIVHIRHIFQRHSSSNHTELFKTWLDGRYRKERYDGHTLFYIILLILTQFD
jgi:hypothetical protein